MADVEQKLNALKSLVDYKLSGGAIDESKGAPYNVRKAVGSASSDKDRLKTVQKFFPNAQAYGDDNFIYNDPDTGRRTLYNPPGLDTGDLYSIAPEGAELAAGYSAAKAITPAALNPATLAGSRGTSALAIPLAYGFGAAGGKELNSILSQFLGNTEDTRSTAQRFIDPAITVATGSIFERLGEIGSNVLGKKVIDPLVRAVSSRANPTGPERLASFSDAGVVPRPSSVSGNAGIEQLEKLLAMTPGGSNVIRKRTEAEAKQVGEGVQSLADDYRGNREKPSDEQLGYNIKQGIKTANQKLQDRQNVLYGKAFDFVPKNTKLTTDDILPLVQNYDELVERSQTTSLADTDKLLLDNLEKIIADVENGVMDFAALRQLRTNVGKDLKNPIMSGATPSQMNGMNSLFSKLSDTMNNMAASRGGAKALKVADNYTRVNKRALERLEFISKTDLDSNVLNVLNSKLKNGPEIIRGLRRTLQLSKQPEVFDDLAGVILGRLGRSRPGQQGATELGEESAEFSASTFLTKWNSLDEAAKKAMFGGTRYAKLVPRLNNLTKVSNFVRDADKLANRSNTAQYVIMGLGLSGITGAGAYGGYREGGDFDLTDTALSAAKAASSLYLGPKIASKMITSPTFVRWLAQIPDSSAAEGAVVKWISRLTGVAKAEPEIREEVLNIQRNARAYGQQNQ